MKLVLNSSTLEIMSHEKENRNKQVIGSIINSDGVWKSPENSGGFFIDVKNGDVITAVRNQEYAVTIAFVQNKDTTTNVPASFANGTSGNLNEVNNLAVTENCYMFVLTSYKNHNNTPESITINGFVLDNNGWV